MEKSSKSSISTLDTNKSKNHSSVNEFTKAEKINQEIDSKLKQKLSQAKELQDNVHEKVEENLKNLHENSKEAGDHLSNMTHALTNLTTAQTQSFYNMNVHDTYNYFQKLPQALHDSYTSFWNTYNNELLEIIEQSNKNPKDLQAYNKIFFTASVHAPLKSYTSCLEKFHEVIYE